MRLGKWLAALCLLPGTVLAKEYACASWHPAGIAPDIARLGLTKSVILVPVGGTDETIRMVRGTLTHRVYLEDDAVWTVYAAPEPGDKITVQRMMHDPKSPKVVQTTCEVRQ